MLVKGAKGSEYVINLTAFLRQWGPYKLFQKERLDCNNLGLELLENVNIFLCFLTQIQHAKGQAPASTSTKSTAATLEILAENTVKRQVINILLILFVSFPQSIARYK